MRIGIGLMVGSGIAAVDNLAFGGEASPILIVGMLLLFASTAGMIWGTGAAFPAAVVWTCLPTVHLVKHMLRLRDTIHPNTYTSILKLGAFSFAVTTVGLGFGLAFRRLLGSQVTEKV